MVLAWVERRGDADGIDRGGVAVGDAYGGAPLHAAMVRSRGARANEGLVVPPWAYRASSSARRKLAWVRRMALGSVRLGSRRRACPPRWTVSAESGGSIEKKEEGMVGVIKASWVRSWCRLFV